MGSPLSQAETMTCGPMVSNPLDPRRKGQDPCEESPRQREDLPFQVFLDPPVVGNDVSRLEIELLSAGKSALHISMQPMDLRFGTIRREILRPKSALAPDTLGVNQAHRHPLGKP